MDKQLKILSNNEVESVAHKSYFNARGNNQLVVGVNLITIFFDADKPHTCATGTTPDKRCPQLRTGICGDADCKLFDMILSRGDFEGEPGRGYVERCYKCSVVVEGVGK
jgi:hypothetical protein